MGSGSLNNYDPQRELTIWQFVIEYQGECFDKYIQARSLDEAKEIYLDQAFEDELNPDELAFRLITIPSNDILRRLTTKTKD